MKSPREVNKALDRLDDAREEHRKWKRLTLGAALLVLLLVAMHAVAIAVVSTDPDQQGGPFGISILWLIFGTIFGGPLTIAANIQAYASRHQARRKVVEATRKHRDALLEDG